MALGPWCQNRKEDGASQANIILTLLSKLEFGYDIVWLNKYLIKLIYIYFINSLKLVMLALFVHKVN